ncbi:MAG: hypothetical protein RRY22_04765 [Bacilli bacterium]
MRKIKILFIILGISYVLSVSGAIATSAKYFSQILLPIHRTTNSTTINKTTYGSQKLESIYSKSATGLPLDNFRAINVSITDNGTGVVLTSPWKTISSVGTDTLPNSASIGYGLFPGSHILQIRTNTDYSNETKYSGTWTYDL